MIQKIVFPAQDIGADELLDRIEDAGVADQIVEPFEQEMRLAALAAPQPAAVPGLQGLEPRAERRDLAGVEHRQREDIAVPAILLDLLPGQHHGPPPFPAI